MTPENRKIAQDAERTYGKKVVDVFVSMGGNTYVLFADGTEQMSCARPNCVVHAQEFKP